MRYINYSMILLSVLATQCVDADTHQISTSESDISSIPWLPQNGYEYIWNTDDDKTHRIVVGNVKEGRVSFAIGPTRGSYGILLECSINNLPWVLMGKFPGKDVKWRKTSSDNKQCVWWSSHEDMHVRVIPHCTKPPDISMPLGTAGFVHLKGHIARKYSYDDGWNYKLKLPESFKKK